MQRTLVWDGDVREPDDREVVELNYYSIRNVSCPEDANNGRKVLFGYVPANEILSLKTDENVRDYLVEAPGKKQRKYTQVHRAIRSTLETAPQNFSVLNGGICMVARDHEIDDKKKVLRLLDPSIINGSQTQGVLREYYEDVKESGVEPPVIHVTFEVIVTEDDGLIAETSIARNFQEDVMTISIAGRLGHLNDLRERIREVYPEYELRTSETHLSDDYIMTERLIQVMTALIPPKLWYKPEKTEDGEPNKTYTYSAKTKCLKDFQTVFKKAEDIDDPEHAKYRNLYQFYLDIAPQAFALHEKWKSHQGFKNTGLHALKRDKNRNIVEVPDGIVFPILAALSNFAEQTQDGWKIVEPERFTDEELIKQAVAVYKSAGNSDPQRMGKSKICYQQLNLVTSLHKRLA